MNITNIDSINSFITSYEKTNDKYDNKTEDINIANTRNNSDYVDFSINYSDDEVASVLNNISNAYDSEDIFGTNKTIFNSMDKYGEILNGINNNTNFDDNTKTQLTKILDNSFDFYTDRQVAQFTGEVSGLLNKAYYQVISYLENGKDIGIKGDKLINGEEFQKNLKDMILSAKNFYRNNANATKDDLEKFLGEKYAHTSRVESLSYSDIKELDKAMNTINNSNLDPSKLSREEYKKKKEEATNVALVGLKEDGASSILIDTFEKAIKQNKGSNARIDIYNKLNDGFDKQLKELNKLKTKYEEMLKSIKEAKEKMEEQYQKALEKLKHDIFEMYKMKISLNQVTKKDDPVEDLTKQHAETMKDLEKEKVEVDKDLKDINKSIKDITKEYDSFNENPSSYIDKYIEKELRGKIE
ncbi:hypothetical protein [Clostridium sp. 'White wine YQ']|uniref:hypothetical protein n=1 Tax=Clostridium sp. 'White wine YQ' TaxID=3027474 RepID=UPI0023666D6E|nr:hypothetical protein [Clostridium sp. 'White wine YQ']MDD7793602.1 hypothetical protein [Clostridium sp. 'White wine YQ']